MSLLDFKKFGYLLRFPSDSVPNCNTNLYILVLFKDFITDIIVHFRTGFHLEINKSMWRLKFRASLPLIRTSLVEKISMVNQLNNMDIRCKDMNGESLLLVMRSLDWPHQKAILYVLPKFVIFLSAKDGYNWSISMDGGEPCYMFCLFSSSSFCLIKRLDFKERILWKEILRMDMDMSCSPNF